MANALPDPGTNRFLDLLQNREPVTMAQALNLIAAFILTWIDQNVTHFSDDPLATWVFVYVAGVIVATVYARMRVWSPESVAKVVDGA